MSLFEELGTLYNYNGMEHVTIMSIPKRLREGPFYLPLHTYYPSDQQQDQGEGDHNRVEADIGQQVTHGQGGEFQCQPPWKYKADKAWNLQRHQNTQGFIRYFLKF